VAASGGCTVEPSDVGQVLGPLAGTLPHAAWVFVCFGSTIIAARIVAAAISGRHSVLLLGSWAFGMVSFVAGCVAFGTFAWGIPLHRGTVVGFIGTYGVPLAAMLVLGAVTAAGIELTRPVSDHRRTCAAGRAEGPTDSRRAEAIGSLGEALVRAELETLGWPSLSNVVLACRWGSAEIDHVVRAPDGIIVIETKTLSGNVSGEAGAESWLQRAHGEERGFQNPLTQNGAHLDAVRDVIGNPEVTLRGLVVSAGRSRYSAPIAGCVVPVCDLARVLRESVAMPLFADAALAAAWTALVIAAERSEARRQAHVAYARSRKRVRPTRC
jgi:hypothetical protein